MRSLLIILIAFNISCASTTLKQQEQISSTKDQQGNTKPSRVPAQTDDIDNPYRGRSCMETPQKCRDMINKPLISDSERLKELMSQADLDPHDIIGNDYNLVHLVAQYGTPNDIESLKSRGANLNKRNNRGETPFGLAIVRLNFNTTKALLENGACLDTRPIYWEQKSPMDTLVYRTGRSRSKLNEDLARRIDNALNNFVEADGLPTNPSREYVRELAVNYSRMFANEKPFLNLYEYIYPQIVKTIILNLIGSQNWPPCTD